MIQSPPDLLTPLSEIIGYSGSELRSQSRWLRGCRTMWKQSVWDKWFLICHNELKRWSCVTNQHYTLNFSGELCCFFIFEYMSEYFFNNCLGIFLFITITSSGEFKTALNCRFYVR
nr:hypothetical protein [Providencia stuartii]